MTYFFMIALLCRVSCHALSELCQENQCPQGLVLEAAFNNLHDEVELNPLSRVLSNFFTVEITCIAAQHLCHGVPLCLFLSNRC